MIAFVLCDSTRGRCRVLGGRHVTVRQLVGSNLSVLSVSECCSRLYMVNQPSRLIPGLELSVWLVRFVT
jgi:hypothetical protein